VRGRCGEVSVVLAPTAVWSMCPVAGLSRPSFYPSRRTIFACCPRRSTSRSAGSRLQPHWLPWCHPATLPEPGYARCGLSGRRCVSSTGTSRRLAGSASNRDRKPVPDNAATTVWHTPAMYVCQTGSSAHI